MTIMDDPIIRKNEDIANISRAFLYNRIKDTTRPEFSKIKNELLIKYPFLKYTSEIILPNFDNRGNIIGSELKINIFKNKKKTDLHLSLNISLDKLFDNIYELRYYSHKNINEKNNASISSSKLYLSAYQKIDNKLLFDYREINPRDEIKIRKFQLSYLIPYELENYHSNLDNLINNYLKNGSDV